jgi:two-component sensor histidine kinase
MDGSNQESRMPTMLLIDLALLFVSFIVSASFNIIVFGVAPKRPLNRIFVAFNTSILVWILCALMLRLSLLVGPRFPEIGLLQSPGTWINLTSVPLGLMCVFSLELTVRFLERRTRASRMAYAAGLLLNAGVLILALNHRLISSPQINADGHFVRELGFFGWLGSALGSLYMASSLALFWRERRRHREWILPVAIGILWAGFLTSTLFQRPTLSMPLTNMISVLILGYSVLNRQLFNPLKEHNLILRKEIQSRIRTEESLKTSLQEKELLLKEVNHRVKNNLQVVSSLLNLQISRVKDPATASALHESQARIRAMSLVHEMLYRTRDFNRTDFAEYTKALVQDLMRSYGAQDGRIRCQIGIRNIALPIHKAIPCGLVVNELVSNAMKYAFPPSYKGKPLIAIRMRRLSSGKTVLTVRDNGIGLPRGFDSRGRDDTLGMRLVTLLVEDQLKGTFTVERAGGAAFCISFPP